MAISGPAYGSHFFNWAQNIQARCMMTFMSRYMLRVSLRLCNLLTAEQAFCLQVAASLDVLHAAVRVSVC